ncbi:MAG: serine O-acetyltransferase EpsC [Pseudomonadota bacterium]
MNARQKADQCTSEVETTHRFRKEIPKIVDQLVFSCSGDDCFDHVGPEPISSRESIIDIINGAFRILYPGYFIHTRVDEVNLGYYFGQEVTAFFEILSEQITLAIRHECLRYDRPCSLCRERGEESAINFGRELPHLRATLAKDVRAAYEGDPAAMSYDEIIFSYPGLYAITVYRIAHHLYEQEIPLVPRIMTEHSHSRTGIDIHPGAHIGESFFIDHGTGVVVGETAVIGDRVRLYQGVTLGALSIRKEKAEGLRNKKRHPTIGNDVIIYAGSTILGGDTVIGDRSVIGGNVWITESVPPDTTVFAKNPELIFKGKHV